MVKELAEKQKARRKNYEVDMTVHIQADSAEHAQMKIDSPFIEITNFEARKI